MRATLKLLPAPVSTIAVHIGVTTSTARSYVRALRREGKIYIGGFCIGPGRGSPPTPIFHLGREPDAVYSPRHRKALPPAPVNDPLPVEDQLHAYFFGHCPCGAHEVDDTAVEVAPANQRSYWPDPANCTALRFRDA
jgi:hypothetical protein